MSEGQKNTLVDSVINKDKDALGKLIRGLLLEQYKESISKATSSEKENEDG